MLARGGCAGRKSVAGPHHRLNILPLPGRYALSPPVPPPLSLSSPIGAPFPVCRRSIPALFLSRRFPISPLDFSSFSLSSFRADSPSRASPYPPFLLARLTKMGPAASGSRFPRKLSSYKINYPPYFIAPRHSPGRGARRRERAVFFLFLPLPVPAAPRPGQVSDGLDSL